MEEPLNLTTLGVTKNCGRYERMLSFLIMKLKLAGAGEDTVGEWKEETSLSHHSSTLSYIDEIPYTEGAGTSSEVSANSRKKLDTAWAGKACLEEDSLTKL